MTSNETQSRLPSNDVTHILKVLRSRIVFFVGSGVSVSSPTNMPTAEKFVKYWIDEFTTSDCSDLLNKLYESTSPYAGIKFPRMEHLIEISRECLKRSNNHKIVDHVMKTVFQVCDYNENHAIIADRIVKFDDIVFTTNFDECIENALAAKGREPQPNIIKLHGSISDVSGLYNTISRMRSGLGSRERKALIDSLLSPNSTFVFLGYSGSDFFDINPIFNSEEIRANVIWVNHTPQEFKYSKTSDRPEECLSKTFSDGYYVSCDTTAFLKNLFLDQRKIALCDQSAGSDRLYPLNVGDLDKRRCSISILQSVGLTHDALKKLIDNRESGSESDIVATKKQVEILIRDIGLFATKRRHGLPKKMIIIRDTLFAERMLIQWQVLFENNSREQFLKHLLNYTRIKKRYKCAFLRISNMKNVTESNREAFLQICGNYAIIVNDYIKIFIFICIVTEVKTKKLSKRILRIRAEIDKIIELIQNKNDWQIYIRNHPIVATLDRARVWRSIIGDKKQAHGKKVDPFLFMRNIDNFIGMSTLSIDEIWIELFEYCISRNFDAQSAIQLFLRSSAISVSIEHPLELTKLLLLGDLLRRVLGTDNDDISGCIEKIRFALIESGRKRGVLFMKLRSFGDEFSDLKGHFEKFPRWLIADT
jgi:NAD-dependent SIR2 family protein deacetylase